MAASGLDETSVHHLEEFSDGGSGAKLTHAGSGRGECGKDTSAFARLKLACGLSFGEECAFLRGSSE